MVKPLIIIIATLLIAFATTSLLSISWVQDHWVREVLVYITMVIELLIGFFILREFLRALGLGDQEELK